jgi:hypothetical protein
MEDIDPLLYELRLIRWHMEFQVSRTGEGEKWLQYLEMVDRNGHVRGYLKGLAGQR